MKFLTVLTFLISFSILSQVRSQGQDYCEFDYDCTNLFGEEYCCAQIDAKTGSMKEDGKNCYHKPTIIKNNGKITIEGTDYYISCVNAILLFNRLILLIIGIIVAYNI
jgi:hypothetical protein